MKYTSCWEVNEIHFILSLVSTEPWTAQEKKYVGNNIQLILKI